MRIPSVAVAGSVVDRGPDQRMPEIDRFAGNLGEISRFPGCFRGIGVNVRLSSRLPDQPPVTGPAGGNQSRNSCASAGKLDACSRYRSCSRRPTGIGSGR